MIRASHEFMNGDTVITEKGPDGTTSSRRTRFLCQTTDPEEKRRIIGDTFMKVATEVSTSIQSSKSGQSVIESCDP